MRFEKITLQTFKKELKRYGFGWMSEEEVEEAWNNIIIPKRETKGSAGHDIACPISFHILPHDKIIVPSGIKAYFSPDEIETWFLALYDRSSLSIKRGVNLTNQTAIIDSDYYENPDNEGDMLIALTNTNDHIVKFKAGERIIQGIFMIHGITEDDDAEGERTGGVGSTNENTDKR